MQHKKRHHRQESARGLCPNCGVEHVMYEGVARFHCQNLMCLLAEEQRIDLASDRERANPLLGTARLFGKERGKMFGVLVCHTANGTQRVLKAFSGQFNGVWEVAGWAPPLFDIQQFSSLYAKYEPNIKEIGHLLQDTDAYSPRWTELAHQRKRLSQQWMQHIHSLYTLANFRGQTRSLSAAFTGRGGISTGTGDCCAPKLFHQAIRENLLPSGLAEFYWGRENASQTRQHGQFYPSCAHKCTPILGFMLCGLEELFLQQAGKQKLKEDGNYCR